jgi:hypothetical protein
MPTKHARSHSFSVAGFHSGSPAEALDIVKTTVNTTTESMGNRFIRYSSLSGNLLSVHGDARPSSSALFYKIYHNPEATDSIFKIEKS